MSTFDDYINFRWFITPSIITIIYLLGALFITILCFYMMIEASRVPYIGGALAFSGLILLVLLNLLWRISCEYLIIQFRIYSELRAIRRSFVSNVICCPFCGSEIPADSNTCPVCGRSLPPPPPR